MTEVMFFYNGITTEIQCNTSDKMKDICERFCSKANIDINSGCFLYNGDKIKEELTFRRKS